MNGVQPSIEFIKKLDKVTEKIIKNNIIFSEIRDERSHVACQEILAVFEANYTSVKRIEEIIEDSNSTDLQKSVAKENLEIFGKAAFRAMNLFFKKYEQNLVTSVLDSESIEEFLPEELKGLGTYIVKTDLQATKEEKEVLLEERKKLLEEEEESDRAKVEALLK